MHDYLVGFFLEDDLGFYVIAVLDVEDKELYEDLYLDDLPVPVDLEKLTFPLGEDYVLFPPGKCWFTIDQHYHMESNIAIDPFAPKITYEEAVAFEFAHLRAFKRYKCTWFEWKEPRRPFYSKFFEGRAGKLRITSASFRKIFPSDLSQELHERWPVPDTIQTNDPVYVHPESRVWFRPCKCLDMILVLLYKGLGLRQKNIFECEHLECVCEGILKGTLLKEYVQRHQGRHPVLSERRIKRNENL